MKSSIEEKVSTKVVEDSVNHVSNDIESNNTDAVVGIPAYNEENTIVSVVLKALRYVDDVVVVDDGSSDETAELAEEAGAEVIRHETNKGYGVSLHTLILYAREHDKGPLVIIDGNAKYPAKKIPDLLENILTGEADITIGSRFLHYNSKNKPPHNNRLGVGVLKRLSTSRVDVNTPKGGHKKITDRCSGFRAFSKKALKDLDITEQG
ncbi:MAG: glycosyltransferase family 2 protein, partial [Thermoplasmatota archaeon]